MLKAPDYGRDLDTLIFALRSNGAYVRDDRIDLARLGSLYRPRFPAAADSKALLPILEAFVGELHDFHAFVGTNNQASPRLVPSGTDLRGVWRSDGTYVEQVRPRSLAAAAGVVPGDRILAIDGVPVREAVGHWLGVLSAGTRAQDWALDSALAGRWNVPRKLRLQRGGALRELTLPTATVPAVADKLTVERRPGGIVVLRPNDSLGQDDLLKEFDRALPILRAAKGIVLDLRETPSGGNTAVARGIMGLFIDRRLPYQRHVVQEFETRTVRDWVEYATPRLAKPVRGKMVVLVSLWTGSMGEGLAAGFDGMRRATVVGTAMAGLRGAVESVDLPVSGMRVFFPTERLYHINGTARQEWRPPVRITPGAGDPWMKKAEELLLKD